MSSQNQQQDGPSQTEGQEADELLNSLQEQADHWRRVQADPVLKKMQEGGQTQVDPLLNELLKAFPPK